VLPTALFAILIRLMSENMSRRESIQLFPPPSEQSSRFFRLTDYHHVPMTLAARLQFGKVLQEYQLLQRRLVCAHQENDYRQDVGSASLSVQAGPFHSAKRIENTRESWSGHPISAPNIF